MTGAGARVGNGLIDGVRSRLVERGGGPAALREADVTAALREAAAERGVVLGVDDLLAAGSRLRAHLLGLGALEPVLADPAVSDVLVNGDGGVHVDRGCGLERLDVSLGGEREVRALAVRLAVAAGRRIDEASPWVDARLPGGLRLHAVLPPLAPEGTHVSLRVLNRSHRSLAALVRLGALPAGWEPVLAALVHRRLAFLVSGGTGAGKTTLLAALLSLVPAAERIVLVEDVSELAPEHPHVVRLEARPANVEGRGGVGLDHLVRQALRMRPDRLVVGECRGPEVRDLLGAMNTGHRGGCGTVHANAAGEVPARLQALGSLAGMSPSAVRVQAAAALDVLVHLVRDRAGRRVAELAVVDGEGPGGLSVLTALAAGDGPDDPGRAGPGWSRLAGLLGLPPIWPPPICPPRDAQARRARGAGR